MRDAVRTDAIEPVIRLLNRTPKRNTKPISTLPASVTGVISPYPTVVMVVNVKYNTSSAEEKLSLCCASIELIIRMKVATKTTSTKASFKASFRFKPRQMDASGILM
jgi:hypothetical protein